LPEQAGVEWLEPTLHDENTINGSTIGGSRTFSYVVKMTRPGVIDLGNLTLSFYSPSTGRYRVVPTALGRVTVDAAAPGAASAAPTAAQPAGTRLSDLVKFRSQLAPPRPASFWADRPGFFWWLAGGPLLVVISALARRTARVIRRRVSERGESQAQLAQRALSEARQALSRAELGSVVSATERALYLAIEWATGVRARALMRSELAERLSAAGLPESLAAEAAELLARCSELRRATAAATDADAGAKQLLAGVQDLVKRLVRRPPARPARSGEELRV
ncbi:MAG TPA: hypothetical protein VG963_10670, partial [Polyangiaceae bacterium]|nr:hypothetical protein [Polyangiaceae bacterium]